MKVADHLAKLDECPTPTNLSYDYDCGDKRSYGRLSVEFDLPFGRVKFQDLAVGSSGGVESGWSEKLTVDGKEVEGEAYLDAEVPHYYSGLKTCGRWEDRALSTLQEDVEEWLAEQWEEAEDLKADQP